MTHDPVLIVGAGPTGLVLAIELARRGVAFRLIDRRPAPLGRDRAVAVKSRTLEVLEGIGIADRFLQAGHTIRGINLFAGGGQVGTIGLGGLDSPYPFDLCLPEEETERLLTEHLEELGGRIERGVAFAGLEQRERGVAVRLSSQDGEQAFEASWVVGTDGLHSAVREAVGDQFEGHEYPARWGVLDAHLADWPQPQDHATVQIEPPVVIAFPLRDGRWRFTYRPDCELEQVLALVTGRLQAISPGASLRDPDEPQLFRTHGRVAHRYRVGRILLAGDAAHVCTPFEGHGMNTGIHDSYNLGWKLALVVAGAAPETLLDSYEAERRPVAEAICRSGDEAEARGARLDTETLRQLTAMLATGAGRDVAALAEAETAFGYDASPIVDEILPEGRSARGAKVGFRVGDAAPLEGQDGASRLHELIGRRGHSLFVMLGEADGPALAEGIALAEAAAQAYGPHLEAFVVTRNAAADRDALVLRDPSGALHERFGADRPCICLVRPDGHLGLRAEPPSMAALQAHLGRILSLIRRARDRPAGSRPAAGPGRPRGWSGRGTGRGSRRRWHRRTCRGRRAAKAGRCRGR